MKYFVLKRRYFDFGTYSTLHRADGSQVCCMVELPWKNNEPFKSCVSEGLYDWLPHKSPKYGDCYILEAPTLGVTKHGPSVRTEILTHIANAPSELLGCMAPGLKFGFVKNQWAVTSSTIAFKALMKELNGKPAKLRIVKD